MGFRRNPLDLNNAPEDFPRDHDKQPLNHSFPSSSGSYRKKKNGGKDESRKVYECRFCSLTFCKSQALGGHMNRHRQERETETLNKARKLVFGNDNPIYQRGSQPIVHGGYRHQASCNMAGAVYPTRPFSATSTPPSPPPPPPPHVFMPPPYSSLHHKSESEKDYFMGHVCTINPQFIFQNLSTSATRPPDGTNNYTCIGAPIGEMFTGKSGGGDRDISLPAINRSYHKDGI